jgi:hypothetical protein
MPDISTIISPETLRQHLIRRPNEPNQPNQPNGTFLPTVALTGARQGQKLVGIHPDTHGVILLVVAGVVAAPSKVLAAVRGEVGGELIRAVMEHFKLSREAAQQALDDVPTKDVPHHQPLGSACPHRAEDECGCRPEATFKLLSQGVWQAFAEKHGKGAEMHATVQEGRVVCWRDILDMMRTPGKNGGKTLLLRPNLFTVAVGPSLVPPDDPRLREPSEALVDAAKHLGGDECVAYDIEGVLVNLPVPGEAPFGKPDRLTEVASAVRRVRPSGGVQVEACAQQLSGLTDGGLKSLLQKVVRYGATCVEMPLAGLDAPSVQVPAEQVAATCVALLFASSGSFSPELQLFTRGCAAAAKRLAVILLEDAWHGDPAQVMALMGLAFALQRVETYQPSPDLVVAVARIAARAVSSRQLVAWRRCGVGPHTHAPAGQHDQECLAKADRLMQRVRSFPGDMAMFGEVARLAQQGTLPLHEAPRDRPESMPLEHMIDQHAFRGIAHAVHVGAGATFQERFRVIFDGCTGVNPRRPDSKMTEEVVPIRNAQRFCLFFALKGNFPCRVPGGGADAEAPHPAHSTTVRVSLHSGVLAAGVGPVKPDAPGEKRPKVDCVAMLGIEDPADEIVMKRPTRDPKDLLQGIKPAARAQAVQNVRERRLNVTSELLPKGRHTAEFVGGEWRLDGRGWQELRQQGREIQIAHVASPAWVTAWDAMDPSHAGFSEVSSDEAIRESLMGGDLSGGIVADAEARVTALARLAGPEAAMRAASMLRLQWKKVSLPTPGLDGRRASDQLAAYPGDWEVWRLLVLVARLVPAALSPVMPPSFRVTDGAVLRAVEAWILRGAMLSCRQGGGNGWRPAELTAMLAEVEPRLLPHQRQAVAKMEARDAETDMGHMLVMDTGLGKTVTALVYGIRWIRRTGAAQRILWVTPKGTVENLVAQLKETWRVPVHQVPRHSDARKLPAGCSTQLVVKDHAINVIHADFLKGWINRGLRRVARSCLVVFDEVDCMYAATERTSAAREVSECLRLPVELTRLAIAGGADGRQVRRADGHAHPEGPERAADLARRHVRLPCDGDELAGGRQRDGLHAVGAGHQRD